MSDKFDIELQNDETKEQYQKLNREQRRRLQKTKKSPEFTKKYSTQNCKSKKDKKNRQLSMMKKGLINKGLWEDHMWNLDPDKKDEMKKYIEEQMKYIRSFAEKKIEE